MKFPGKILFALRCIIAGLVLLQASDCGRSHSEQIRKDRPRRAIALSAAAESTCAVLEPGKVACVGRTGTLENLPGIYPQSVAARDTGEIPLSFTVNQLAIASNQRSMHACAVSGTGRVYCWGRNTRGQLGVATDTRILSDLAAKAGLPVKTLADFVPANLAGEIPLKEKALQVVTGYAHTCALSEWEYVMCWGDNSFGQLGQDRRLRSGQIGQSFEPMFVPVISRAESKKGLRISRLAAGDNHTCALLTDGHVRCWGHNYFGQLGHVARPVEHRGPDEAMLVAEPPEERGNVPVLSAPEEAQGLKVSVIAAAGDRSCAILSNGKVRCWGKNFAAALGYPDKKFDKISQHHPPHELGDVQLSETAKRITMSSAHTCVVSQSGKIFCWGSGTQGQLGQPGITSTEKPGSMPPAAVPLFADNAADSVVELALGDGHSCALMSSGSMRCWGQGFDGQLGTGTGKIFGKVGCRNAAATCLGDESEELPPPDVLW